MGECKLPLVSVIIPVYNVEKYLEECINSVLNQTMKDFEVICVDDGSEDNSLIILENFSRTDKRVKVFRNEKNMGQSYARNKGFIQAEGKYTYFLDSDDMIEKETLSELFLAAEQEMLDLILFDGRVIYDNEKYRENFKNYKIQRIGNYSEKLSGKKLMEELITNKEWSASVPRQFWRTEFLRNNKITFKNNVINEDELFSFKAILMAQHCKVIKKQYFIRRFRDNSTMTKEMNINYFKGYILCYAEMLQFCEELELTQDLSDKLEIHLSSIMQRLQLISEKNGNWIDKIQGTTYSEKLLIRILRIQRNKSMLPLDDIKKMQQSNTVMIYGAGNWAKRIFAECIKNNIEIDGFIVTDLKNNSKELYGKKVISKDELDSINITVIVGVKDNVEILKMLEDKKIQNIVIPSFI